MSLTAYAQCISDRTDTLLSEGEEMGRNPIKNQSQKTDPKQNKKRDRKLLSLEAGILNQARRRPHQDTQRIDLTLNLR